MNVSITLSTKEAVQVHQILKAFDEGLIVNPSEDWELDHYDEKIADRTGLKTIIKKIEKPLPKEESEKTKKTVLRRKYDTFNNEINESDYSNKTSSGSTKIFVIFGSRKSLIFVLLTLSIPRLDGF